MCAKTMVLVAKRGFSQVASHSLGPWEDTESGARNGGIISISLCHILWKQLREPRDLHPADAPPQQSPCYVQAAASKYGNVNHFTPTHLRTRRVLDTTMKQPLKLPDLCR